MTEDGNTEGVVAPSELSSRGIRWSEDLISEDIASAGSEEDDDDSEEEESCEDGEEEESEEEGETKARQRPATITFTHTKVPAEPDKVL